MECRFFTPKLGLVLMAMLAGQSYVSAELIDVSGAELKNILKPVSAPSSQKLDYPEGSFLFDYACTVSVNAQPGNSTTGVTTSFEGTFQPYDAENIGRLEGGAYIYMEPNSVLEGDHRFSVKWTIVDDNYYLPTSEKSWSQPKVSLHMGNYSNVPISTTIYNQIFPIEHVDTLPFHLETNFGGFEQDVSVLAHCEITFYEYIMDDPNEPTPPPTPPLGG